MAWRTKISNTNNEEVKKILFLNEKLAFNTIETIKLVNYRKLYY